MPKRKQEEYIDGTGKTCKYCKEVIDGIAIITYDKEFRHPNCDKPTTADTSRVNRFRRSVRDLSYLSSDK